MLVNNREFHRKYQSIEEYEAGIVLRGGEVKSVKAGNIRLDTAYVKIFEDGAWLINADVPVYRFSRPTEYNPLRKRKLLLNKKEIERLQIKVQSAKGLTIIPLSCYNKGRHVKLNIALARGRGDIEKKNREKKVTMARNEERDMKEYMKYDE
ncbi:SsrA-binding protein SmpB [soil metagenome]